VHNLRETAVLAMLYYSVTVYLCVCQDDPLTPEICDFEDGGVTAEAETSPDCFTDLDIDDTVYTATTINLHDLE